MASFFKGSCVVYWLCWLGCLAYFFGTFIYTSTYVMPTKQTEAVSATVKFLCFFNVFMAFFGCVFVKCSITHVLCAALYIMPILGVNAAFCIMGVIGVRNLAPPTPKELMDDAMKSLNKTGRYPKWMVNVQRQLPCCGVNSYLDFPLFFNKKKGNGAMPLSHTIPESCCQTNRSTGKGCNDGLDNPGNETTQTVAQILKSINSSRLCSEPTQVYPYTYNMSRTFAPANDLSSKIFFCGCYNDMNRLAAALHQSHFIFFLVLLAAALVMAFVYIKVWCKHRGSNVDSGSDHSLEVDDVSSVHSIKPDEAPLVDLGNQHPNLELTGKSSTMFRTHPGSIADPSTGTIGGSSKIISKPKLAIPISRKVASVMPMHPPKK